MNSSMFQSETVSTSAMLPLTGGTRPRAASMRDVEKVLRGVRIKEAGLQESDIQEKLHEALILGGFPQAEREVKFAKGCRADIWVDGIVIEVKKKRPDRAAVATQLYRYARQENVRGVILVLEKSILLPEEIEGKRIAVLSLNALWGVAL